MSFWFQKKDKDGRINIIAVEVPIMLIIPVIGILAGLLFPAYINQPSKVIFTFFTLGILLVFIAKTSLFNRGIWCSWGWGLMENPFKTIYGIGYLFILFGVILLLPFWN